MLIFDNQDDVFEAKSTLLIIFGNTLFDDQDDMLDEYMATLEVQYTALLVIVNAVFESHDDVFDAYIALLLIEGMLTLEIHVEMLYA